MESGAPNTGIPANGPDVPTMSFMQRLIGVYFEPRKTFQDISQKPTWIALFIIVCVLAMGVNYTLTAVMDHETLMRKSLAMNPMTRNMSEEQIQQLVSQPRGAFSRYSGLIFAPLGVLVSYAVTAGVFLLVFVLMGAAITFKKSLAATVWGMAPPGIILTILSIVFMFIKDPADIEISPAGNVASNLGMLVSEKEHPVISSLLSSIDVFSFWTIFLLSIGFAALSDRSLTVKKAATGVLILWLLWVLGKAGYFALFG
ncbi:MAG: YIP1 family protein [Acidobacteria bacterium]|nr:YIP1 family protein [Acidobacteriota bacterium]